MSRPLTLKLAAAAIAALLAVLAFVSTDTRPADDVRATSPTFAARPLLVGQSDDFVGPPTPDNLADLDLNVDAEEVEDEDDGEEEVAEKESQEPAPKPKKDERRAKRTNQKRQRWKPAVLQVVTDFSEARVTVNGLPYPTSRAPDEPDGMVLPAGGPHNVEVKVGNNSKHYNLHLRPYETRLLLVELTNFSGTGVAPPPPRKAPPAKPEPPAEEEKESPPGEGGQVTVYSKPAGTVISNGTETGDKTPGTVDLPLGRHELQVRYETGAVSEKKIVRVRNGSKIKLFFRER